MAEQIGIIDRLRRRRQRRIAAVIRANTIVREPLPPMPPFSVDATTCRYPLLTTRRPNSQHTGGREAMIRTCPTCGYEWPEALPTGEPT